MGERIETLGREQAVECWHFLGEDRRLRYGSRESIEAGSIVSVEPPLEWCHKGLHGSVMAIDALAYSPGPIVSRAAIWGDVIHGESKLCGQHREVIWMADASGVLHRFACSLATEALDLVESRGGNIDAASRNAIAVKLAWLAGEATGEDLTAARLAAGAAARASMGAPTAVAWAAWAASAAAWNVAWAAARGAMDVTMGVARVARNRRLHDLLAGLNGPTAKGEGSRRAAR